MTEQLTAVVREFPIELGRTFGTNLAFAFICGSVARSKHRPNSDIDFFVCLYYPDFEAANRFRDWYYHAHETAGMIPDRVYPCELMDIAQLDKCLRALCTVSPSLRIHDRLTYDAIVWAGMLAGQKHSLVGESSVCTAYSSVAKTTVRRWKHVLLAGWRNLEPDMFLKQVMVYDGVD